MGERAVGILAEWAVLSNMAWNWYGKISGFTLKSRRLLDHRRRDAVNMPIG